MRTVTAHRALTICAGTVLPSAVPASGLVDASQPEAGCTPCDISGHTRHLSRGGGYGVISHRRTRVVIEVDGKQHCAQGDAAFPRICAEMPTEDRSTIRAGSRDGEAGPSRTGCP